MQPNRILIVDDQIGIRMMLEEVFTQAEYEIEIAENGLEAIQKAEDFRPRLALLDMKLPGMDGIDIMIELKKKLPDITVFMMTAYGELELIEHAKKLGVEKYFTKPFDIDEVLLEVDSFFNTSGSID